MAGGGSPRQKMINMMYLVLTAMLALNVSKEILDAFVVVNEGMLIQKTNIEKNNGRIYGDFNQQKLLYPDEKFEKIKPWYDRAQRLRQISNDLVDHIENMKVELIALAESKTKEEVIENNLGARDINKKEEYDIPTNYFGTDDPSKVANGKAAELRNKLASYRDLLLSTEFLKELKDTSKLQFNLNTDDVTFRKSGGEIENKSWEFFYFYHLPMPAALTELTKWQNNVRGAEGSMLTYLFEQIAGSSFKFDAVKAAIIPKSNVVFAGNNFEADIFLAAYNTTENPEILVNGAAVTEFDKGRGLYKVQASGEGEKTVSGIIKITDPVTGQVREEPFETKYQVSKPMMTVTPDQMNVFYRGLDNPITVSVPGVAPSQISATCSGCASFSPKGNGQYILKPGTTNEASINVSIKKSDGTTQNMGAAKFRVKRIPDPKVMWAGKETGTNITAVEASNSALIPQMFDFDFPVYATIQSFTIGYEVNGTLMEKNVTGNRIPSEVPINRIAKGKKIYLDKIVINMPDGTKRSQAGVYTIR